MNGSRMGRSSVLRCKSLLGSRLRLRPAQSSRAERCRRAADKSAGGRRGADISAVTTNDNKTFF